MDRDANDKLTLKVVGLPPGLSVVECEDKFLRHRTKLKCMILGVPTEMGEYDVVATATDSKGNSHVREFHLRVTD